MWSSLDVPDDAKSPLTDYTHWRLNVADGGGHTWEYLHSEEACAQRPQSDVEKFWLGLRLNLPSLLPAKDALEAARNGFTFYKHLQAHDGHWPGVYDGPMFLLPGLVISNYVTGASFKMEERLEMVRYLLNKANPDGGWGIHIEGPSTCFGTALNYVVMRLLGVRAEHMALVKARGALHKLGGAAAVPAWGKFWLSVLNVYDWAGNHCIPGELWLLPEWLPFHPHRWWIHTRNVYIPMAFLYGVRFKAKEDELILALREELYVQSYDTIDWPAQRNNVAAIDTYVPHHPLLNFAYHFLNAYEACAPSFIRKASLAKLYELIVMEDENTAYQTLGPVSKTINMVARYHMEGSESDAFKQHLIKQNDFMWVCPQGLMMSGTNGSQLWDLAFITQAVVEGGMASDEENKECFVKVLTWFDECQIKDNPKHYEKAFRHATKGAWPFSTREQSYVVSDCTGEGLKAVLYLQNLSYMKEVIPKRRLCDAVDVMLSLQNKDGGFASYELVRGPKWLEMLNCAEVFGNIMIEYCYPECTTSVITALAIFRKHYPDYRSGDIDQTINAAIHYLHETQRPEGGWFGSWGICFTYATQFALESLSLVGETYATSESVRRACAFLISKQREDGGWGESYKACELEVWIDHEQSQVVNTSWAAMALMYAQYPKREPIERAVRLVMSRQLPDGSWAQEGIEGIFNKTCAIAYPNFKFAFTIWMLGMAHKYLAKFQTVS